MGSIKNIQERLGRLKLKRELKTLNRSVKAFNIDNASSIGIIYNATNRTDAEIVKKFVQYLKEERKEVSSLGFIDLKENTDIVTTHINYQFFYKTHLTKSLIPKNTEVKKFISTPFSILIDLSYNKCFPIEYITSLSNAKFKVGATGNYRDVICDMTISISEKPTIEFLIIQVRKYLKMINN